MYTHVHAHTHALPQALLTLKNLATLASGGSSLAKWSAPMEPKGAMLVTLGHKDGVLQAGGCVCRGV